MATIIIEVDSTITITTITKEVDSRETLTTTKDNLNNNLPMDFHNKEIITKAIADPKPVESLFREITKEVEILRAHPLEEENKEIDIEKTIIE